MDNVVRRMHSRSGLLAAIDASSTSLVEAGRQTLEFLRAHIESARAVPLCGNSIGTDRRFLATYLADVDEFLHYRSIDVSSVKELCRRWYPDVLAQAPAKAEAHRALEDIRESIAELAYYRSTIFAGGGTPPVAPS
jgi:oligoribonuclease